MNSNWVRDSVQCTLEEDVGSGDITALLIDPAQQASATVITREPAVVCGIPWFNEVYRQLDETLSIQWQVKEGAQVSPEQELVILKGNARSLVTGERSALNWLQWLSGIATHVASCVASLQHTKTQLLDTRKTIPTLRYAQKYAVTVGGGHNHRMGLYDAYLIKENHIVSCGSITQAVKRARALLPNKVIEVEVESLEELTEALDAKADIVLLDNFSFKEVINAVKITRNRSKIEVSGNLNSKHLADIATAGIDFVSMGTLTRDVRSIDCSMRLKYK